MSDKDVVELMLNARKAGDEYVQAECIATIRGENGAKPEYRGILTRAFMAAATCEIRDFVIYLQLNRLFSDRELFIFLTVRGRMKPDERAATDAIVQDIWGGVTISRIILMRLIDSRIGE